MTQTTRHPRSAARRKGDVLELIVRRARREVLARNRLQAALEAMTSALGAEGCAVIDMLGEATMAGVLHQVGGDLEAVLSTAMALLHDGGTEPNVAQAPDGRPVLLLPGRMRFGEQLGLAFWRTSDAPTWTEEDTAIADSASGIVQMLLEHGAIQHQLALQARSDSLTGLLNRRAFGDELARRLHRLAKDGVPGTLIRLEFENLPSAQRDRNGQVTERVLCTVSALLRGAIRTFDLAARIGSDGFALWLDGADEFSAAERAERLRIELPGVIRPLAGALTEGIRVSTGIAAWWPGHGEPVESLLRRADTALAEVRRAGGGHWRVAQAGPIV